MSVFVIAEISIRDRETYGRYEEGFMEVFARYEGEVLSVDEAPSVLEGEWQATRSVLLRFPTEKDARAWYESSEYQELARHRFAASTANVILVQGLN
jgi:uncharacterized protein (DUF1330 family)